MEWALGENPSVRDGSYGRHARADYRFSDHWASICSRTPKHTSRPVCATLDEIRRAYEKSGTAKGFLMVSGDAR